MQRTLLALAVSTAATSLGAQKAPDITPYLTPDRAAEVALARTAAPSDVSAKATVLVLTRTGYTEAARGTNGFTCLVLRSFAGAPNDPGFWNPRISAPHCFNPPAVRTVLPAILAKIGWALAGATPGELKAKIAQAYAAKTFPLPAPGAIGFMLSPQQHLSETDPHWMPHLMLYYDRSLTASALGAGGETAPIIDASAGDSSGPMQVFYIPTRTWSDGTPAMRVASAK